MKTNSTFTDKFKYLIVFLFILLNGISHQSKAQLVLIPDAAFRTRLVNLGFASCMTGNFIDSTCALVQNCTYLNLDTAGIIDVTGIGAFRNLKILSCYMDTLTFLPSLPPQLDSLNLASNQLTSLPSLPSSLIYLNCELNNLSSVPPLPNSLVELNLYANHVGVIPFLPATLTYLNCDHNEFISLPPLPGNLLYLGLNGVQYTVLPPLPLSLTYLDCSQNQIDSLPNPLPPNLKYLYCYSDIIHHLPPLPNSLYRIDCDDDSITVLPTLPSSLVIFHCGNNMIDSIPPLPVGFEYLYCEYNQLTKLPAFPSTMLSFTCSGNQLTELPTIPPLVHYIVCDYNPLTALPALPPHLRTLDCSNDIFLTCLPQLNVIDNFIYTNTSITCLPNYGQILFSNPDISTMPLCDYFNPNGCYTFWNISGRVYDDVNANCVIDSVDSMLGNFKLNLIHNGNLVQQGYSGNEGFYSFDTDTFAIYQTEIDTTGLPFTVDCPSTFYYQDTLTATDSLKYDRNFSVKCKNGFDLAAWGIDSYGFVPGHVSEVEIAAGDLSCFYNGHCASGTGGVVSIVHSGLLHYTGPLAGALTPTSISGDTLFYTISDFGNINCATAFGFGVTVDTLAAYGTLVCITVAVSPASDNDPSNNTYTKCFLIRTSFDPNEKEVSPLSTLDMHGDRWLTYTVRFQNTGNAPAINIHVIDTLNPNLDLSTFQLVTYSHQPNVQIYDGGIAKFNFPYINLIDSTTDEPHSHGYFQYKIRAKDSLAVGTQINNTAYIYFDYNSPIVTNTVFNTLTPCPQNIQTINVTLCNGGIYNFNGLYITQSGSYTRRFTTGSGCDSVVTLNLIIQNEVTQSNNTLTASANNATYQWINCTTGVSIPGATFQSFTPTANGSYAVFVTTANCTVLSGCHSVNLTGIKENTITEITIAPNPTKDEFVITCPENKVGSLLFKVFDVFGKLIEQREVDGTTGIIKAEQWPSGIYLLRISDGKNTNVKKLVKE